MATAVSPLAKDDVYTRPTVNLRSKAHSPGGAWLAGWRHVVKVTYEGGEGSHRFRGRQAAPILAYQQASPADMRRGARQTANIFSTSYGTVGFDFRSTCRDSSHTLLQAPWNQALRSLTYNENVVCNLARPTQRVIDRDRRNAIAGIVKAQELELTHTPTHVRDDVKSHTGRLRTSRAQNGGGKIPAHLIVARSLDQTYGVLHPLRRTGTGISSEPTKCSGVYRIDDRGCRLVQVITADRHATVRHITRQSYVGPQEHDDSHAIFPASQSFFHTTKQTKVLRLTVAAAGGGGGDAPRLTSAGRACWSASMGAAGPLPPTKSMTAFPSLVRHLDHVTPTRHPTPVVDSLHGTNAECAVDVCSHNTHVPANPSHPTAPRPLALFVLCGESSRGTTKRAHTKGNRAMHLISGDSPGSAALSLYSLFTDIQNPVSVGSVFADSDACWQLTLLSSIFRFYWGIGGKPSNSGTSPTREVCKHLSGVEKKISSVPSNCRGDHYLEISTAFEAETHGSRKDDTVTHTKCTITAKSKCLNWRGGLVALRVPRPEEENEVRLEQSRNARGQREIPYRTGRPAASSGTIPTCENPSVTRPEIEPGSTWWEASSLAAQSPRPLLGMGNRVFETNCKTQLIKVGGSIQFLFRSPCSHRAHECTEARRRGSSFDVPFLLLFARGSANLPCAPTGYCVPRGFAAGWQVKVKNEQQQNVVVRETRRLRETPPARGKDDHYRIMKRLHSRGYKVTSEAVTTFIIDLICTCFHGRKLFPLRTRTRHEHSERGNEINPVGAMDIWLTCQLIRQQSPKPCLVPDTLVHRAETPLLQITQAIRPEAEEYPRRRNEARMEQRRKWEIPEKTHRPPASSGTIPICENPGVTKPGIEPGSPLWETDSLTAETPRPLLNYSSWHVNRYFRSSYTSVARPSGGYVIFNQSQDKLFSIRPSAK
ncbi:hypothetical protein PR048_027911 [Dryococelus australis]|uniref:Uncharacterized protein n=1 Tax=Dryococelus australis TaxID=614101 RepID=A0ABQ9GHU1_9NEOP|nr:hypothetical protein PR048_027911 [Dryococelus australis]